MWSIAGACSPSPPRNGTSRVVLPLLKRSLAGTKQAAPAAEKAKGKKPKKRAEGQREMLLPISGSGSGKRAAKEAPKKAAKPVRAQGRAKKAG